LCRTERTDVAVCVGNRGHRTDQRCQCRQPPRRHSARYGCALLCRRNATASSGI
jgi:hypothetical protein